MKVKLLQYKLHDDLILPLWLPSSKINMSKGLQQIESKLSYDTLQVLELEIRSELKKDCTKTSRKARERL